ncbi:MAG: hypothetical protein HOP31_14970 [Ignavibacteria bacterium]|nr:hypothetical protein [Ignavibacteria bacterium]
MIEKVIKQWMLQIIQDHSWEKHNDLHIDEISDKFVESNTWINGGFDCFTIAKKIRNELKLPYFVELRIVLNSTDRPKGMNFKSISDLFQELSWTPPSLYLYEKGYDLFQTALKKAIKVDFIDLNLNDTQCYYFETLSTDDPEYYRSLAFVSEPL